MQAPVDVCVDTDASVNVGVESQLSVAVTVAGAGMELHSTVASDGQPESTGAVVSCTVMTCEQLDELPQLSVAVQVRVIV